MVEAAAKVGCGVFCVLFVMAIILIAVSIKQLGANEYGLDYSGTSKTIDFGTLYSNGVHFTGPSHHFIIYRSDVQEIDLTVENNLIARTSDGLQVTVDSKLFFRLDIDVNSLGSLYLMFADDYITPFTSITQHVIRDVASNFTAFEFWTYRDLIQTTMQNALSIRLNDFYANVEQFLLSNFELPVDFQNAITETEVAMQAISSYDSWTVSNRTQVDAQVQQYQQHTVPVIIQRANTTAQSYLYGVVADVQTLKLTVDAEVTGYQIIEEALGFSKNELITYVWIDQLFQSTTASMYFSLATPANLQV